MNRLDMNKIADKMTARSRSVTASVADFKQSTQTMVRVVLAFNTLQAPRETLYDAVAASLGNQMRPVEGSFREVSSFGRDALVGYVALNQEVKPYEEAAAKRMTALCSNMLMDTADDSLWDVRTDAAGNKLLCRQSQADISELMVTARVRQKAPKLANIQSSVHRGEFVSFVDPRTETVRSGYVLATDVDVVTPPVTGIDVDPESGVEVYVMPENVNMDSDELRGDGESPIVDRADEGPESFIVPSSMIIEAARLENTDVDAATASAKKMGKELSTPTNSQSKEAMKSYYKEMFEYAPAYYADLVKMIDQHANI